MIKSGFSEHLKSIVKTSDIKTNEQLLNTVLKTVDFSEWIGEILNEFQELDTNTQKNISFKLGETGFSKKAFFGLYINIVFSKHYKIKAV